MGSYAGIYEVPGADIPKEKQEEFKTRVEKLFQAGGMLKHSQLSVFGVSTHLLKKPVMAETGVNVVYNYFEDNFWEDAGYSTRYNGIYSDKVGGNIFSLVMIAAYTLQQKYLTAPSMPLYNDDPAEFSRLSKWLNHLFDDSDFHRATDYWQLYESMMENPRWSGNVDDPEWKNLWYYRYTNCAIKAANEGLPALLEELSKDKDKNTKWFETILLEAISEIEDYRKASTLSEEEQVAELWHEVEKFYTLPALELDDAIRGYSSKHLMSFMRMMLFFGLPIVDVIAIAHVYGRDHKELWAQIKGNVYKANNTNSLLGIVRDKATTQEALKLNPDDMTYYWEDNGEVVFSDEQNAWFAELKKKYDDIVQSGFSIGNPFKWLVNLLGYADEKYYQIWAFEECFNETCDNLSDARYMALWKIFYDIAHDPEMEKEGESMFTTDWEGKRKVLTYWNRLTAKNNKARTTLRRYLGLIANKELRMKVFGV